MDFGNNVAVFFGAAPQASLRQRSWKVRIALPTPASNPDLQTQLEELLNEVWKQEAFERDHPFTCGVIRDAYSRAPIVRGMR